MREVSPRERWNEARNARNSDLWRGLRRTHRRAGYVRQCLGRPAVDLVIAGRPYVPPLVVARRLNAEPPLTVARGIDRNQIDRVARRKVHAEDVGETNVRLGSAAVVSRPGVEDQA